MTYFTRLSLILASIIALAGCYHPDIQQGNNLSPQQISQLKLGMTKDQVITALGSPVLSDVFNPNRLVYIYTNLPNSNVYTEHKVILTFSNNKLTNIDGSYS